MCRVHAFETSVSSLRAGRQSKMTCRRNDHRTPTLTCPRQTTMLGRSKSLKKTSSGQISSLGMSISEEGPAVGVVEPASASSSSPAADGPASHVPTGLVNGKTLP